MHTFVHRVTRGAIICLASAAITACAGISELSDGDTSTQYQSLNKQPLEASLPRIDAIRLRVARNAMANGDYDTAIRFFESVRDSAPHHPAPLVGIAQANMASGSHQAAILAYHDVLKLYPTHEQALDGIGRAMVKTGQYHEAVDYFNQLLAKAPSSAVHNRLGVAHDLLGDGQSAQKHYLAALEIDPESISARNNLALSLAISEKYADAVTHMERVAAHPEATEKHRQNLAFVYGMAGEDDQAVATLTRNGLSTEEIYKNQAVFAHVRTLVKAGNRAEILAYLRSGEDIGDPAMAEKLAQPSNPAGRDSADSEPSAKDTKTAMVPDTTPPSRDATAAKIEPAQNAPALPAKSLNKNDVIPEKEGPQATQMAKVSEPAKAMPSAPEPAKLASVEPVKDGIYRIQLASYRTAKGAERGRKILRSILRDETPELEVLVRQNRSTDKRAFDFRIRTPQVANRDQAAGLCAKIQAMGHPDCLVILHNPQRWAAVDATPPSDGALAATYRVQLASFRTAGAAARGQAVLTKLMGDRPVSLDILVRKSRSESPLAFDYRIRTGPIENREEGLSLCETLKQAGHDGCFLIQHNDRLWENLATAEERDKAFLRPADSPKARHAQSEAAPVILPAAHMAETGNTHAAAANSVSTWQIGPATKT